MHFKILPVILLFLFALVVAKVFDLALEKGTKNNFAIKSDIQAVAESKAKEEGDEPEGEADAATDAGGEASSLVPQSNAPKNIEISDQVPMEKALLESLSKRRTELDDWANSIAMKESVLNATEKKITNKMDELKKLETEVTALLAKYNSKEDEKNKKLVKIYEGMKPAEAAKIFDTIDMNILLEIVVNMKEDSAAKILAKMNTTKAKDLTTKLAEQRRLTVK